VVEITTLASVPYQSAFPELSVALSARMKPVSVAVDAEQAGNVTAPALEYVPCAGFVPEAATQLVVVSVSLV
jgi:hypothetical protein